MKRKVINGWQKVWEMWNEIDNQDALLKSCAIDVGYNGNKTDKEQLRKILWLLEAKYKQNTKLIQGIIASIDGKRDERF